MLHGTIEEYRNLYKRLKSKDYNGYTDKESIIRDANKYREYIKEKMDEGFEKQKKVQIILRGIGFAASNKAIFRVEAKKIIKTQEQMSGYEAHMFRLNASASAHPELSQFNTVLYGEESPYDAVLNYYKKYNLKQFGKGANKTRLLTDLLYTVSPQFFLVPGTQKYDFELIDKWVDVTMNYIKQEYGSDLVWAQLHLDESSPHLHVLVVGRQWHEKWQREVVSHSKHFGGKGKLVDLQSNYANALQRGGFIVQRGLRGSLATHKSVEKWRAEQKERDKQIYNNENNIKDIIEMKDREREEAVLNERLEKQARNKVLRDICKDYSIDPNTISEAIDNALAELAVTKKKYQAYKSNDKKNENEKRC